MTTGYDSEREAAAARSWPARPRRLRSPHGHCQGTDGHGAQHVSSPSRPPNDAVIRCCQLAMPSDCQSQSVSLAWARSSRLSSGQSATLFQSESLAPSAKLKHLLLSVCERTVACRRRAKASRAPSFSTTVSPSHSESLEVRFPVTGTPASLEMWPDSPSPARSLHRVRVDSRPDIEIPASRRDSGDALAAWTCRTPGPRPSHGPGRATTASLPVSDRDPWPRPRPRRGGPGPPHGDP